MKKIGLLLVVFAFNPTYAQTPCENGMAGNYDCQGLDLQSHISAQDLGAEEHDGIWVNDIWGWVDPTTNKEYALVGMSNGTSFVDVSDPINPVVLGILPEHNSIPTGSNQQLHEGAKSIWRDIKVYGNYAYVVSEDPNHGLQVFDLTTLRDVANPSKDNTFSEAGHYAGIGQAHNIFINEETGYLYAVGFRQQGDFQCNNGGLHIVDLSNPTTPVFAGCFDTDGYTHDTQCVIYRGPDKDYQGMEICFNSNEEDVVIVNVNDKENIVMISKNGYEGAQYAHQGWLTPDHKYFISNDELDERNLNRNTRTLIWDVQDLDEPVLLGYFEHENKAIDHNLYTLDSYVFESNYTNGLRVLDTTGISQGTLREIAHFDSFVSSDATIFDGTWSNYPYLPSGNIIFSDITNGLFVVKMQDIYIAHQPQDYTACVGEHVNIPIVAIGDGITYQWQIDQGNGFKDIDNFERYKNTTTAAMHAHTLEKSQDGNKYRCIVSNGLTDIISDPMTLHVLDSPVANFSYSVDGMTGNIVFTNKSEFAEEYIWDLGDGLELSTESPEYEYQESGTYNVMLVASNGCTSDTLVQTIDLIVAAINELDTQLKIYPSISNNQMFVETGIIDDFRIEIFSMRGRKVFAQKFYGNKSELSLSHIKTGLYVLKVSNNEMHTERKIIITK